MMPTTKACTALTLLPESTHEVITRLKSAVSPSMLPRPVANTSGSMQAMLSMMPLRAHQRGLASRWLMRKLMSAQAVTHKCQTAILSSFDWDKQGEHTSLKQAGMRSALQTVLMSCMPGCMDTVNCLRCRLPHSRLHDGRTQQHDRQVVLLRRAHTHELCQGLGVGVAVVPAEPASQTALHPRYQSDGVQM